MPPNDITGTIDGPPLRARHQLDAVMHWFTYIQQEDRPLDSAALDLLGRYLDQQGLLDSATGPSLTLVGDER